MDTFMDQLAEKMNAQSMIHANEAGEIQMATARLQESVDRLTRAASSMEEAAKQLRAKCEFDPTDTVTESMKTNASANDQDGKESATQSLDMAELRENGVELKHGIALLQTSLAAIDLEIARLQERFTGYGEDISQTRDRAVGTKEALDDLREKIDGVYDELKAFRDTPATIESKSEDQELMRELKAGREEQNKIFEEKLSGMNDDLKEGYHKECVKVYRNVQGALREENEKQAGELVSEIGKLTGKGKLTLCFVVLAFVMSFGSLALQILTLLKILP